MITYNASGLRDDLVRLERGDTIVCNPIWHDAMIELLRDDDTERGYRFFNFCATWPNPKGCGTLDTHLASYNKDTIKVARQAMYPNEDN